MLTRWCAWNHSSWAQLLVNFSLSNLISSPGPVISSALSKLHAWKCFDKWDSPSQFLVWHLKYQLCNIFYENIRCSIKTKEKYRVKSWSVCVSTVYKVHCLCTKLCLAPVSQVPPITEILWMNFTLKPFFSSSKRINPKIVKLKSHQRLAFNNQGHLIKKIKTIRDPSAIEKRSLCLSFGGL